VYLAFTNATGFSPTDVMPLVPCARIEFARAVTQGIANAL
jgi:hypothetical protein